MWATAQQLAGLAGMPTSERRVREKAKREGWPSRKRKARGGGNEFHIDSLPIETQANLLQGKTLKDETLSTGSDLPLNLSPEDELEPVEFFYDKESLWQHYERKSDKQKSKAQEKLNAIQTALSLINNGVPKTKAWQAAADTHKVHMFTLRDRWYESVKQYEQSDWVAALIPGYIGRTKRAECDETAFAMFKADYLRLEQPTLKACYERLKRAADAHGWTIPSEDTLARRIKSDVPHSVIVLMREGEQALYHMYPAQKRSVRDLHALEAINCDGYKHNVFVKYPDGEISRPKTWFNQDIHSRKILSYRTDRTENTDVIRLAFGDLVEQYGIPKHVVIDNTRAAANKWMTGGVSNRYRFKVKEDDPLGLFPQLGVQVHWTSVFNGKGSGQSKPVERAFGIGGIGEVVDKHPALAGCYTGNNVNAKPENYGSKAIAYEEFLVILEQEIIAFNARLKRNTEMCVGVRSFDQVFNESYTNAAITKATEAQRRLWLLSAEAVQVKKEGTITLDAGSAVGIGRNRYRAAELYDLIGQKVVVRFDPQELHNEVFIYDLKGRFIANATCIEDSGFFDTQTAREHGRARKQFIKANKAAAKAEQKMDVIEASRFLPQQGEAVIPEVKVVTAFKPAESKFSKAERDALAAEIQNDNNVEILETPKQKYQRWLDINSRIERTEDEAVFHEQYQKTAEYRAQKSVHEDFELMANAVEK